MLLALGVNVCSTLDPSSKESFLWPAREVALPGGSDEVLWTSWSATVARNSQTKEHFLIGLNPSPATALELPDDARPRSFIGMDQLDAILDHDGRLWVEQEGTWVRTSDENFRDVAQLGTGEWLAIKESDPSVIIRAPRLDDLLLASTPTTRDPHTPAFSRVIPSASHCLLSPDQPAVYPPHALGSNLHSQLNSAMGSSSSIYSISQPVPLHNLSGQGEVTLQCAGVFSCAVTEAGDVWVWGGHWGVADAPLPLPEPPGEDPSSVSSAAVSSTGALVVALEHGAVFSIGLDEEALKPPLRPDLVVRPAPIDLNRLEWEEMDLTAFGVGLGGPGGRRRAHRVISASGGRGFFFSLKDATSLSS